MRKTILLLLIVASTLSGCIVVPARPGCCYHPYYGHYYAPAPGPYYRAY